ncbi:MAG: hypothetical protein KIT35_28835 [Piscinibacter sp.]|uniref:hypothetical protein n=1 Tax=Piscinibacter sp. TaxID=1903157 RepID=UPI00258ADE5B|nr:hypothetical protein [Piscinibacter sp.]MCW5667862.1 hypothetical protein [Piscinibacter sp.]
MLIVTSCSFTKRVSVPAALRAARYRLNTADAFARTWVRNVRAASDLYAARDVYGGPAVASAARAAAALDCDLYFVSAGMSLVDGDQAIPGYDLTISSGSASAPAPLRAGSATPSDWWLALNKAYGLSNPFASVMRKHDGLILVALPSTYLRMVEPNLLTLTAANRKRLRLVTMGRPALNADLQSQVIGYDARLNDLNGALQGTQSSAAQRALLHFASLLNLRPEQTDIDAQRLWVSRELARAVARERPLRTAQTDAQIAKWIRKQDPRGERAHSVLLRMLRAAGFACEQRRFRRIAELSRVNVR